MLAYRCWRLRTGCSEWSCWLLLVTPVAAQPDPGWFGQLPDLVLLLAAILISISSSAIAVSLDRCCCRRSLTTVTATSTATSSTSPTAPATAPATTSAAASSSNSNNAAAAAPPVNAATSPSEVQHDAYIRRGGHAYHILPHVFMHRVVSALLHILQSTPPWALTSKAGSGVNLCAVS